MRTQRDQVATTVGVAAAAVALTSLGLPWFKATTKLSPSDVPATGETTGWHFMTTTDIVIAILAVAAIVLLLINRKRPYAGAAALMGVAIVVLTVAWMLDPPGTEGFPPPAMREVSAAYGAWTCLLAALVVVIAAAVAMRERVSDGRPT